MNRIDLDRLTSLLSLDADTGQLHWKTHRQSGAAPGGVAGGLDSGRYIRVEVDGVRLSAHRVAWALHHGAWPPDNRQVDHINGDKTDNRPANLRLATNSQNQVNTPVRSGTRSGLKGVDWINRVGKWRAKIMVNKVNIHIGYFADKDEAHAAYCAHSASLHGQYTHPESVKPSRPARCSAGGGAMGDQVTTTALPDAELQILRHSLGVGDGGWERSYRNHFVTGEGGADHRLCMALVARGFMVRRAGNAITGGSDLFNVTLAGRAAAVAPPPKLTRGQRRYAAFLRADDGSTFGEWLRMHARRRSLGLPTYD